MSSPERVPLNSSTCSHGGPWASLYPSGVASSIVASILLANWYFKATQRALQGDVKRKYFEHAGALLTADGTDDELIKLEGTPPKYKLIIPTYTY